MSANKSQKLNRRDFLKNSALAAGSVAAVSLSGCAMQGSGPRVSGGTGVSIFADPSDAVASAKPSQWAVAQLRAALTARNVPVRVVTKQSDVNPADVCIRAGELVSARGQREVVSINVEKQGNQVVIAASGSDNRGLVYALTELADIAGTEPDPLNAMLQIKPTTQRPANKVRSCMRMFSNDIEDKPWFNDKEFWKRYLTMLVAERFNRVNLSFGLSYDAPSNLDDTYLYFSYPFLLAVPGYNVRATNLPDSERDRNLEMVRWISDEAAARGLHFQLGLWTHAYEWVSSPRANHVIEGLTPETQAPYCRDALAILLKECPNINGVTFRIHGESGVAEGSYDLWRMIFDGCKRSGRIVEIDMHAKGMDQGTIDAATSTGLPLTISPKYWAEHMGLPYHQAAIRQSEQPTRQRGGGAFAQSNGARSFLRYGYGDLLTEDRKYGIIHRMWPGTQRLLLWGDPTFAASFGRASSFCGSLGCEIMEPLSFKGRKGSGIKGDRGGYADARLIPPGGDFEKFAYTYRMWGRLMYDPDEKPEVWQRQLRRDYGLRAPGFEIALASASRILPFSTTAHLPAASNNQYWPEIYVNMPIASIAGQPFNEGPTPRRFGTVSPLDPQLFSRIEDHIDDLLKGQVSGKYSPAEVALGFDTMAREAADGLGQAQRSTTSNTSGKEWGDPKWVRLHSDVQAQIGLGEFFGHKFRAGLLYALFDKTGSKDALDAAIKSYRAARDGWVKIINATKDIYVADLTYGPGRFQRGHWSDRLAGIDLDITTMEGRAGQASATMDILADKMAALIKAIQSPATRPNVKIAHTSPAKFDRGKAVSIELDSPPQVASIQLMYRHTHQGEFWQAVPMKASAGRHSAEIPAAYTDTPFPLIYYFELTHASGQATLSPGFNATWSNQPYHLIRQV